MCKSFPVPQPEPFDEQLKASSPQVVAKMCEETAEAVIETLRGATTVMLCDIPLTVGGDGPAGIVALLQQHGLEANVDYIYLPRGYGRKSKRRCNGSLSAFVNFTSSTAAAESVHAFHNYVIDDRRVYVCRAASQGVASNLLHFRSVRSGRPVLETAWPWVSKEGTLQEIHPFEVGAILGIEPEIEALRALAQAEAEEKKAAEAAKKAAEKEEEQKKQKEEDNLDAASTAASEGTAACSTDSTPTEVKSSPFSNHTDQVLPVSPEMVQAYANLMASFAVPQPELENWWAGQLDWTIQQAQRNAWQGYA